MASSRSKEETTARGDREGLKEKCQSGRRCHGSTVALMVASMVASVVAAMASMASMVVPLEWLNLMVAEPKRGDERVDGLTHKIREERADELTLKIEGAWTVALMMASVVAASMAPVAPLMASMAPIASLAFLVASMALLVAFLASMASMMASLDRLRFMIEPKSGEERADGLTHIIREERVDELIKIKIKIDAERVERLTRKIREERVDG